MRERERERERAWLISIYRLIFRVNFFIKKKNVIDERVIGI